MRQLPGPAFSGRSLIVGLPRIGSCVRPPKRKEEGMSTSDPSVSPAARNSLDPLVERVEVFARQKPAKAISAAFGTGLLLALLPIGSVVTGLLRLVLLLLRPVLLVLGLVRLYEEFGGCCRKSAPENAAPVKE
jgi:hypothetical protein